MIVLRCQMCGGELEVADNIKTATCKFCGTTIILQQPAGQSAAEQPAVETLDSLLKSAFALCRNRYFKDAYNKFKKVLLIQADNPAAYMGLFLCDLSFEAPEDLEADMERWYRTAKSEKELTDRHTAFERNVNWKTAIKYAEGDMLQLMQDIQVAQGELYRELKPEKAYEDVEAKLKELDKDAGIGWQVKHGKDIPHRYEKLAEAFAAFGDYRQAQEHAAYCRERAKALYEEYEVYDKAAQEDWAKRKKKNTTKAVLAGIVAVVVVAVIVVLVRTVPRIPYNRAEEYASQGQYGQAVDAYLAIGSDERRELAENVYSAWADSLAAGGDHDGAIALIEEAIETNRTSRSREYPKEGALRVRLQKALYAAGAAAMGQRDYVTAIGYLEQLAQPYLLSGELLYYARLTQLGGLEIGDTIGFGVHRTGANATPIYEAIEWLVLEQQDGRTQLLSRDILRANADSEDADEWEQTGLYQWLNGTFYKNCLAQDDAGVILAGASGGKVDTLTMEEFQLLPKALFNATGNQSFLNRAEKISGWWVASPVKSGTTEVVTPGKQRVSALVGDYTYIGMRPVIWVDNTADWQEKIDHLLAATEALAGWTEQHNDLDGALLTRAALRSLIEEMAQEQDLHINLAYGASDTKGANLSLFPGEETTGALTIQLRGTYFAVEYDPEDERLADVLQAGITGMILYADPTLQYTEANALAAALQQGYTAGEDPVLCVGSHTFVYETGEGDVILYFVPTQYE